MSRIIQESGIQIKDYIKDLYENTPVFDEVPPNFEDQANLKNKSHWSTIS